jgi:hypothetical protein
MAKFEKGQTVKVRTDTTSPYRGRIGVVAREPVKKGFDFLYIVKFEGRGFSPVVEFIEKDLEAVI